MTMVRCQSSVFYSHFQRSISNVSWSDFVIKFHVCLIQLWGLSFVPIHKTDLIQCSNTICLRHKNMCVMFSAVACHTICPLSCMLGSWFITELTGRWEIK